MEFLCNFGKKIYKNEENHAIDVVRSDHLICKDMHILNIFLTDSEYMGVMSIGWPKFQSTIAFCPSGRFVNGAT